jgi:parallel beta-helix repeat protein
MIEGTTMRPVTLLTLLTLTLAADVCGMTFYVAPGGSGSVCTQTEPCAEIATGGRKLQPGDTLYLRGGTYAQPIRPTDWGGASGTSYSQAITMAGYPGETAIVTGIVDFNWSSNLHYWILKDFTLDGTGRAQNDGTSEAFYAGASVHHVRLDNMTVQREPRGWPGIAINGACDACEVINSRIRGWEYGLYITGTNWLIHNNEIDHNEGYGVHIYDSGSSGVSGNTVSQNRVHDNGLTLAHGTNSAGILLSSGSNNRAMGNTVWNQGHAIAGIQLGRGVNQVTGNTIYSAQAPCIDEGPGSSGSTVQDNICHRTDGPAPGDPVLTGGPVAPALPIPRNLRLLSTH